MTQDIKELLGLAAKACRYATAKWPDDVKNWTWRPDLDDGDGARMEAQLRLDIKWFEKFVFVYAAPDLSEMGIYERHTCDRQAARRMASLRVAAEIGRRMRT